MRTPYTGDVYWCENFPSLSEDGEEKGRFAVVISPTNMLPDATGKYLLVPTSCTTRSIHKIPLPNLEKNQNTTSGLPNNSSAVCDRYKHLGPEYLTEWVGQLRTPVVTNIQTSVGKIVLQRIEDKKQAALFAEFPRPKSPTKSS